MNGLPTHPSSSVIQLSAGRFVDPGNARILIGILSCEKHRERADGIRNSWLKLVPTSYRVLFIHGRPNEPEEVAGDCLYLNCPESYETLPQKVHAFLRYSRDHFEFDYLFKTDDDTYLDLERFISFDRLGADYIGQFREQPMAERGKTWHYGKCTDKSYEVPYERPFVCPWATGAGYLLSRKAVDIASAKTGETYRDSLFEDMMVGEALAVDPRVEVRRIRFSEIGVINPLLPKDMLYVQDILLEKHRLASELHRLRTEMQTLRT